MVRLFNKNNFATAAASAEVYTLVSDFLLVLLFYCFTDGEDSCFADGKNQYYKHPCDADLFFSSEVNCSFSF